MGRPALVVGDFRVQEIVRGDGRRCYTIIEPDGSPNALADSFLRTCTSGTSRTYGYLLLDHLRWLPFDGLTVQTVALRDLQRYMGAVGAQFAGPFGSPWRVGKRPYAQPTLETAAACLKGFYLHLAARGINVGLEADLRRSRLPTRADRRRAFLGHVVQDMPANPLQPSRAVRKRHPKMLPEGARAPLSDTVRTARDRLVVAWLADGGFRVGELCGLHLVDLHLRDNAECGECRSPHVHICHRETNPNGSRAKTKHPWRVQDGVIRGGLLRRASPAMIHTYFEYVTTEYPHEVEHGMLLVALHGVGRGRPWASAAVRAMLARAGVRAGLGRVRPHAFRHSFASAVLDATGGNIVYARDAGGWASATTVDEIYGHADIRDPAFAAALTKVWGDVR